MPGLRELVKKGELSPKDALARIDQPELVPGIVQWLKTTGQSRYEAARAAKQKEATLKSEKKRKEEEKAKKKEAKGKRAGKFKKDKSQERKKRK